MKLMKTIGQIKTLDLTNKTFTIDPIAAYKFTPDPEKGEGWKIILRNEEATELKLCDKDAKFRFEDVLVGAMALLKQSKAKIKIGIFTLKMVAEVTNGGETAIVEMI